MKNKKNHKIDNQHSWIIVLTILVIAVLAILIGLIIHGTIVVNHLAN